MMFSAWTSIVMGPLVVVVVLLMMLLQRRRRRQEKVRTMIIFGSGGHTTEMLRLTGGLDERYEMYYVVGATDTTSVPKVEATRYREPTAWLRIPRAREVGQSWLSTVFSTFKAFLSAVRIIVTVQPDLVIANGPGTCLPLCVVARLVGARLIFVESWCRVQDLSLTGKLLYPIAHRFLVHWPRLLEKYPSAEYRPRLC